jgi:hypothetical protein
MPLPTASPRPVVRARLSVAMLRAVDLAAAHTGQSRSEVVRHALLLDLSRRGLWPPTPISHAQ